MSTTRHMKPYLNDGSGCEKCNFSGRFGGWINGHWNGYPQIRCPHCGPAAATIAETIEHADISATQHEHDIKAMREVEAGTYPRAAENRFGG